MTTAPLLPAEAAFCRADQSSAARCLQAALLALLGQGHIEFGEESGIFTERKLHLMEGDGRPLAPHLAAMKAALDDYKPGIRSLKRSHVIHALQKRFGLGYGRFVRDHLAPSLIERGLIVADRRRFSAVSLHALRATMRGPHSRALLRLMRAADELPVMIKADPDRAIHLIRSAGVLLVMSPKARRQIPKLRKLIETRGGDAPSLSFAYVSDKPEAEWETILEIGDIALSDEAIDLFDSLDSVGDFTSGDGGSDGGDGGGGGD